jgi:hypothetical protein
LGLLVTPKGFKDGKREGMARRKAMIRHMTNKAVN